ncbi:MAG: TraR/DksA C4-type zinc finger protein [Sporomusaceae bacterium]|nr:TraR/DksA C4-type zinc finger protein [Sporomusaceae bacterium]
MKADRINYFKRRLHEEKEGLIKQISGLEKAGLDLALGESIGELSVYDNHPADIGDELFERSKDLALRDNAHILMEDVESSLKKIAAGTYGYCDVCNQQIPLERLEALPWANECIDCQRDEDGSTLARRPIEEQLLTPPFKRTFLDNDEDDSIGFDGEDALQAVMRYGSSDSPQDLPGTHDYEDLFSDSDEQQGIVDHTDAIRDHYDRQPNKGKL